MLPVGSPSSPFPHTHTHNHTHTHTHTHTRTHTHSFNHSLTLCDAPNAPSTAFFFAVALCDTRLTLAPLPHFPPRSTQLLHQLRQAQCRLLKEQRAGGPRHQGRL